MTDFLAANPKFLQTAFVNAVPSNWSDKELKKWDPADEEWETFANKWRNIDEKVFHAESRVLDLAPIRFLEDGRLLIRDCYVEAEKVVWKRATQVRLTGVIFTGQSGIGKSFFILYLLVRLLRMKQVVLLHTTTPDPLLFWHDKVYVATRRSTLPSPSTGKPFIWSLIDHWEEVEPPALVSFNYRCFPVQAPSPHEVRYKIWRKHRWPLLTGLPLWTRKELAIAVRLAPGFQEFWKYLEKYWKDLSHGENERKSYHHAISFLQEIPTERTPETTSQAFDNLLDALISRFGPIPRDVIAAMYDLPSLSAARERALLVQLKGLEAVVWEVAMKRQFSDTTSSHRVVMMNFAGEVGEIMGWEVKFKCKHNGRLLSEQLVEESENEARSFIKRFLPIPEGRGIAGTLFEALVHRDITRGIGSWSFCKMPLQESEFCESVKFVYDGSAATIDGFPKIRRQQVRFANHDLPERLVNDEYYVLSGSDHPLIHSFIVHLDLAARSAHLWVLQITTSEKHAGSENGYVEVHKIIETVGELFKKHDSDQPPPRKKLTGQEGKPAIQVHYVLVCPDSQVKPGLEWQLPKGWDEEIGCADHRGDGYLLKFRLVPEHVS